MGFNGLSIGSVIGGTIMLAIAFQALGQCIPQIQYGLNNLTGWNGTTYLKAMPFSGLFHPTGIIILALLGAVLMGVVAFFGFKQGR